jgi:AcrR family transcriptional regulator
MPIPSAPTGSTLLTACQGPCLSVRRAPRSRRRGGSHVAIRLLLRFGTSTVVLGAGWNPPPLELDFEFKIRYRVHRWSESVPPSAASSEHVRGKQRRRREAILHAALRAFRDRGYHATTLEDIARRLDVRKTALYYYFPDKESILYECHRQSLTELERILAEARALATPGERLRHVIREHVRVMTDTLEGSPLRAARPGLRRVQRLPGRDAAGLPQHLHPPPVLAVGTRGDESFEEILFALGSPRCIPPRPDSVSRGEGSRMVRITSVDERDRKEDRDMEKLSNAGTGARGSTGTATTCFGAIASHSRRHPAPRRLSMRPVVLASLLAGLFAFGPSPCRAQVADSSSAVADSSAAPAAGEPAPPPARKLPGVDAPDPFPRGCVDCHVNTPERNLDTRLSTLMNGWTKEVTPALLAKAKASSPSGMPLKGKHPVAKSSLQNIPRGCVSCHGTASKKAPPLTSSTPPLAPGPSRAALSPRP